MDWGWLKRKTTAASAEEGAPTAWLADRFQLQRSLGRGAAGEVFEALDTRTGHRVALKRLPLPQGLPSAERAEWLLRLHREAEVSRRIQHPHILAVLDVGLTAREAWLAMERVHGSDLARYTQADRLLPEGLVCALAAQVARALAHAHKHRVIHRDLKPANLLVDLSRQTIKVADFGVARDDAASITRSSTMLGTPAYMAPELLVGQAASPGSDAYALGVTVYELLSGHRPHEAQTLGALLQQVATTPAQPLRQRRPDLPEGLTKAVDDLLAAEAERREDLTRWAERLQPWVGPAFDAAARTACS